ncbi:hypothetical protein GFL49_16965 [Rhizobium leguminosarum bv. viciae]|nr:hypothetical protein [Rhizobium leguminosarum bv. viciae]
MAALTLTLSLLAGRGDVPCERSARNGEVAAVSLLPSGRRCRQAVEGATRHTPLVTIIRRRPKTMRSKPA